MDKETYKVAQKVHDDILFFTEGKKQIHDSNIILPLPIRVREYIIECLNKKLRELENEFKQL